MYYYIITDNEKILEYAKENGAEVLEAPRSIIVNVEKNDLKILSKVKEPDIKIESSFKPKTIDEFLSAFPNLDMTRRGVQYLKYILRRNLVNRMDYARLAYKFRVRPEFIRMELVAVFAECITNIPKQYREFFEQYECEVHWSYEYVMDFIKACQDYVIKNDIRV